MKNVLIALLLLAVISCTVVFKRRCSTICLNGHLMYSCEQGLTNVLNDDGTPVQCNDNDYRVVED